MKNTISRLCGLLLLVVFVVGCSTAGVPPAAAPAAEPIPTPTPHDPTCLGIIDFSGENAYSLYADKPNKVVGWTFHLNFRGVPTDAPTVDGCFRVYVRDDGNERFTPINGGTLVTCTVNSGVTFNTAQSVSVTETSSGTPVAAPTEVGFAVFDNGTITCPFTIQGLLQQADIVNTTDWTVKAAFKGEMEESLVQSPVEAPAEAPVGMPTKTPAEQFDELITNYVTSNTHTYDDFTMIAATAKLTGTENDLLTTYHDYVLHFRETDDANMLTFPPATCLNTQISPPESPQNAANFNKDILQYWWYDRGTVQSLSNEAWRYIRFVHRDNETGFTECVVDAQTVSSSNLPPVVLPVGETMTLTIGPLTGTVFEVMIDPIDAKPPALTIK